MSDSNGRLASTPKMGIEEEYQLVDPNSGALIPNCKQVMRRLKSDPSRAETDADIHHELHLNQIEMASDVCQTLDDIRQTLQVTRGLLIEAASKTGVALAAAGTHPMSVPEDPAISPGTRYQKMTQRYQQLARDLFIFGCHVHVSMPDREFGLEVMNRSRRWLPLLQAVSANSPFWDGYDTGYASYRRELWVQWPMAGPPPHFDGFQHYEQCIEDLIRCGAIADESFLYWDIRLPTKVPTIEFRCADVMTSIEQAVGFVGLVRAIVMQASEDVRRGQPAHRLRPSVLRFAMWQAARYGVSEKLIDPHSLDSVPLGDWIDRVLDCLRPALDASGDRDVVSRFLESTLTRGSGAEDQRRAFATDLRPSDVVFEVVRQTAEGTTAEGTTALTPPGPQHANPASR